jgi:hypothetical protein
MSKRFTDTEIWEQDWVFNLPSKYKLFFLCIKDKCDVAGIWRPNISYISSLLKEDLNLKEFLSLVNTEKERVRVLDNGRLWIINFFTFQCSCTLSLTTPLHKSAMKSFVANNIHPKEIPLLNIGNLINMELDAIKDLLLIKSSKEVIETINNISNTDKPSNISNTIKKEPQTEQNRPVSAAILNNDWILKFYEKDYKYYKSIWNGQSTSEENLSIWKDFVKLIIDNKYDQLFECHFPNPHDFYTLVSKEKFTKDKWNDILKSILGTGIDPKMNLYFRIPQYLISYNKKQAIDKKVVDENPSKNFKIILKNKN